ncbi:MAG TPA: long-chain fatty acid--CoA ligase [Gammaproteobacteria bacterium]|nr:long-chain fatty acid--CoA ligase [Gammaproteobacteria bacterium]
MSLNLATSLRESARDHPDRIALVLGERTWTYAALHTAVRRFAGALTALRIERGRHLALLLPNTPEFTIAYFGAAYAGCPIVPLNALLTADEIAYHLDDADAVALLTVPPLLSQARQAVERVDTCRHLIVTGADAPAGAVALDSLLATATPVGHVAATNGDDTAVVLYTSGTTGKPKGAELTHLNLVLNAHLFRTELLPLDAHTVALCALPLFHIFGQTAVQNAVLAAGGTVVLLPRFDATAALTLMARHRVSYFAGVPTMYFALLNHPEARTYDIGALRHCVSGGAPLPVEVMRAFEARHGVDILEGYGLSETSPAASFNTLARGRKPGSVGVPVSGCEMRLVDESGREITAPLTPGEIEIKGHNVMKGYWKRPEATAAALKDGWFATGDVGRRDADGYYFVVDRKKDMIIRGGYKVYPREVEEVLYAHPAVAEAAVVGIAHPSHGEEVKAVIAKRAGHDSTTAEDIVEHCKLHLAAFKYPRVVEFRSSLPKGPSGKILKRELRA